MREWFTVKHSSSGEKLGVSISPDGKRIATTIGSSNGISIWSTEQGSRIATIPVRDTYSILLSHVWPTDEILVSNDNYNRVCVWDTTAVTPRALRCIPGTSSNSDTRFQAVSDDGEWAVLSGTWDGPTELWSLADGTLRYTLNTREEESGDPEQSLISATFDVRCHTLTGIGSRGVVFRWSISTGALLHCVEVDVFRSLARSTGEIFPKSAVSRNGDWVCWARHDDTDNVVHVAETKRGARIWSTHGHSALDS